jgi:hypothetical protein
MSSENQWLQDQDIRQILEFPISFSPDVAIYAPDIRRMPEVSPALPLKGLRERAVEFALRSTPELGNSANLFR